MHLILILVEQRKRNGALHQIWHAVVHLLGNLVTLKLLRLFCIALGTSILLSVVQNLVTWLAGQGQVIRGLIGNIAEILRRWVA